MEFDVLWFSSRDLDPGKVGGSEILQWDPAGRVSLGQQSSVVLRQEMALCGREELFWGAWKCCQIVSDQQRRETSALPVTSLWPRLQLVLGYFLSQIAHPRRGAERLSHSEPRARSSLKRQTPVLCEHILSSKSWLAFTFTEPCWNLPNQAAPDLKEIWI